MQAKTVESSTFRASRSSLRGRRAQRRDGRLPEHVYELLHRLHAAGLRLSTDDDTLVIRGAVAFDVALDTGDVAVVCGIDADDLRAIRRNRGDLLEALRSAEQIDEAFAAREQATLDRSPRRCNRRALGDVAEISAPAAPDIAAGVYDKSPAVTAGEA